MTNSQGVHNYEYDNIDQLIQATHPSLPEENFMYDPLGNRNPLVNTHNAANRLLEDPDYTYTYDANGNRITREDIATGEVTTYHYNVENQLTQIDLPDGTTVSYFYDGLGRRIEKNVAGEITRYIYDGMDILAEFNGANELVRNYVHGPSIDEPLELTTGASTYYYISDGLGSVTALIDSAGNIVEQYRYDSFGNTTILNSISEEIPASAFGNRYMFTAREYDTETGLYYYRLRYYDSMVGRFLQEDPVGYLLGLNLYTYVNNNPVNYIDPWGLWTEDTHYGRTKEWAEEVGFGRGLSDAIGRANTGTDTGVPGGTGPWPGGWGDQSRHFDIPLGGIDSRDVQAQREFDTAVGLWRERRFNEAIDALGRGLHSLQDKYAHGKWDPTMDYWLDMRIHPDWYDVWNDPRNLRSRALTEIESKAYLERFLLEIKNRK